MSIKIRPSVLIISLGLVTSLVWAVSANQMEMVSTLAVALVGALTKLTESEEASYRDGQNNQK